MLSPLRKSKGFRSFVTEKGKKIKYIFLINHNVQLLLSCLSVDNASAYHLPEGEYTFNKLNLMGPSLEIRGGILRRKAFANLERPVPKSQLLK